MTPINCLITYFAAVFVYCKNVWMLARDNDYLVAASSLAISTGLGSANALLDLELFGVSNHLLLLVMLTIGINTIFGIARSKMLSREALAAAEQLTPGSPDYNMQMRIHNLKKYDPRKLLFVFFKAFTLCAYLYFIKVLLADGNSDGAPTVIQVLDFTTEVLTRAPVAIFWYYEFKSIGENSTAVFGKKSIIFTIAENIFEPRIGKFFNRNNTPNE